MDNYQPTPEQYALAKKGANDRLQKRSGRFGEERNKCNKCKKEATIVSIVNGETEYQLCSKHFKSRE